MVGLNPTQNSFPHRLEWLNRESITYRENIVKEGTVIRENKTALLAMNNSIIKTTNTIQKSCIQNPAKY